MKKLKTKIIRKELRAYRQYYYKHLPEIIKGLFYNQNTMIIQSALCLRHGFEIECFEGDKAYLIYPNGKQKIVELKRR